MKNNVKINFAKKIYISIIILFIILTGFIFCYYNCCCSKIEEAEILLEEGFYQKASDIFYREIKIKTVYYKVSKILNLKNKNSYEREINNLLFDAAFCCFESGNIAKALTLYSDLYSNILKSSYDEAFCNFIKLQKALCYSSLGYYNKALPIYQELRKWYPQNLIITYINLKDFDNAKEVLLEVQDKINQGDDVDAVSLNYLLWEYYKESGQYDKALKCFANEIPAFDLDLIRKIHYADLYFRLNKYEMSEEIYEQLINNPQFSQKIQNKMKLKYAIVLFNTGNFEKAENIIFEVIDSLKESYKYSPDIICAKYYLSKMLKNNSKSQKYLRTANSLFVGLHLTKESNFYNNIEEFCRVNNQY